MVIFPTKVALTEIYTSCLLAKKVCLIWQLPSKPIRLFPCQERLNLSNKCINKPSLGICSHSSYKINIWQGDPCQNNTFRFHSICSGTTPEVNFECSVSYLPITKRQNQSQEIPHFYFLFFQSSLGDWMGSFVANFLSFLLFLPEV